MLSSNCKIKIRFPSENKHLRSTTYSSLATQPRSQQQNGRNTPLRCFQAVRCLRIRLCRDWWRNWHWLNVLASPCSQRSQGKLNLMYSQALVANGTRSTSLVVVRKLSRRQQSPTTLTTAEPSSPSAQLMSPRRTTSRLSSRTSKPRKSTSTCSSALLEFLARKQSPSTTTPTT